MVYGVQCVMMAGTAMMPPQYADNWDTATVSSNNVKCTIMIIPYFYVTAARGIPTRGAYFGEGSGPIHLSRAQCSSRDTRLTYCNIDKTGMNQCTHNEDAGVICMGNNVMII